MWRDPFEEMRRFQREMNRLFATFWGLPESIKTLPDMRRDIQSFREPLIDMKETNKELIAYIEIPGVDKEDIQLDVTDNNIKIKAEKKAETKTEKDGYIRAERSYSGFYRSMNLPCRIIPERVKASYKNGVLEVVMPKAEKKKTRKVKIE